MTREHGPSKAWYWVAGALVLLGLASAVFLGARGVSSVTRAVAALQRVDIPGSAQVELTGEPHVVYYEGPEATPPAGVDVVVRPTNGSGTLDLQPYLGSLTYSSGATRGTAVYTFTPPAGTFTVTASGPAGGGRVAIGRSIGGNVFRLVGGIFGAFAIAGVTFVIAVVIVVVVAVQRSRASAQSRR